jgi:hypothetical protein
MAAIESDAPVSESQLIDGLRARAVLNSAAVRAGAAPGAAAPAPGGGVVMNPVAGLSLGAGRGGAPGAPGAAGAPAGPGFRRLRRQTITGDAGFTTFTSGIRAGWHAELTSRKFRQVC